MKFLSRDFTIREKVLLGFLLVILLGLAYYLLVDMNVRSALERAESQKSTLETELTVVQARVAQLRKMQTEIDKIKTDGTFKQMPSYNNSKEVTKLLNNVLGELGYRISFANVAQEGELVRRNLTLNFTADNYETVERVLAGLAGSEYRCLIGNVSCATRYVYKTEESVIDVTAAITFYETTVDGKADQGIADQSAA